MKLWRLDGDLGRAAALERAAADPLALQQLEERWSRDPDIVLAAVEKNAQALRYASSLLLAERFFALEAVRRNRKALQFLPAVWRADRAIVVEAVRHDWSLVCFAGAALQKDHSLRLEACDTNRPVSKFYQGECLRLVGFCNSWCTTDSLLRFSRVPSGKNSMAGSTRHRLVAYLENGCLSFQVFSCTRLSGFRIYPLSVSQDGYFRLLPDDPFAVTAAIGDKHAGHGCNFWIEEKAASVVSIYVDVVYGSTKPMIHMGDWNGLTNMDAYRGAAVWYEVERNHSQVEEAVWLLHPLDSQQPHKSKSWPLPKLVSGVPGPMAEQVKMLVVDEGVKRHFKDLLIQARDMGDRTFQKLWRIRDLGGDLKLTLLVNNTCTCVVGFCLTGDSHKSPEGLWIHELTVAATHRNKGLGLALLKWVLEKVDVSRYKVVQLQSYATAVRFYQKLGFTDADFPSLSGCKAMELTLPCS
mmetsp:Transcript_57595/g.184954  ORF Transcript_57595/g.184954 Transcript_57595/m.184954 type:complete len:468 (-) Transcript_57595:87-1490(-)